MNGPVTQHPTWMYRFLPEFGWETHVLASSVYVGENLGAPPLRGNVHSVPEGKLAQIVAARLSKAELLFQGKLGLWDHGFAWARAYGIAEGCRLIGSGGFKAILSVSPSISSHWAAYKIKCRFPELNWIADFTDPFLGNPFRASKNWLMPHEKKLEQAIFSTADYLGANTHPARELWMDRYPQFAKKFVVIPNGYDPDETIEARPVPQRVAPILAHAGGIYGGRTPNALFAGLYDLARNGQIAPDQVVVEFLGANGFSNALIPAHVDYLSCAGFIRVRKEYVPRQQALQYCEQADSLLLLDITAPHNTKLQVPSKLFDYLRIGRPILAFTAADSPSARILDRSGVRHVTIPNDASAGEVTSGILRFLSLPREVQPTSEWVSNFDARRIIGKVAQLMNNTIPPDFPF